MKLLYITNGINGAGGLERVLSIKASYLAEHYGYDIHILVLNNMLQDPFYFFNSKIKFHSIDVGGNPFQYFKSYKNGVQKIINDIQPDIVSVCDDGLKAFFLPTIIITDAKWVYERHASQQLNKQKGLWGRISVYLMKSQVSKFDKFVVLTSTNAEKWNKKNVIYIPNPLSFYPSESSELVSRNIIAVGSHSYNKGYDTLIRIWKTLESQFPEWRLNVFGKIDREQKFVRFAQELKLKNVTFHNPTINIEKEFLDSSIMVLPSRSEGFGMVLIEAMSCGVPCIAFDCPSGPADIITDKEDGFIVENQNEKEFSKLLKILIENEELRRNMGKKAKENARAYLPEKIIRQWDVLFREMII